MNMPLLTVEIRTEADVVLARQRARQIADLMKFAILDQTRIATATSEIARNAFEYAGGGKVEFLVETQPDMAPGLMIRVRERGPGISDLQSILDGQYISPTGLGLGILGAKQLMDRFEIESTSGTGSVVTMVKILPKRTTPFSFQEISAITRSLSHAAPRSLLEELQQQNQELLRTLHELRETQSEVAHIHARELEETNRGVVALFAEFEESSNALRRISDLKTRFLSNMSHEFRSPLNTILSLSNFLLDRTDGDLTAEQEKQVSFIQKAAQGLTSLVNDLLDLAKVEAGKAVVRPQMFEISRLFETLRDATLPLMRRKPLTLVFEEPAGLPSLFTDEGKVAQILNNFLSNAVKFTERGELRVSASAGPGNTVIFSVADTGIGIAANDRARIFEEFGQVENPIQTQLVGTGLGLPLSRRLAELLGGTVSVRSEVGVGSTFFAILPCHYHTATEEVTLDQHLQASMGHPSILVVEDDPMDLMLYQKYFEDFGFQILPARNLNEARRVLSKVRPAAVILDVILEAESGWTFLTELKQDPTTKNIPVFVLTVVDGKEQALALGADDFRIKPIDPVWLRQRLSTLEMKGRLETVLIIDDEASYRYMLSELLAKLGQFAIHEAATGHEGLRMARKSRPDVIFLDLVMDDMTGFEVLKHLKSDPHTQAIPIIINTSKTLEDDELRRLVPQTSAFLPKMAESREDGFARVRKALATAGLGPLPSREGATHD